MLQRGSICTFKQWHEDSATAAVLAACATLKVAVAVLFLVSSFSHPFQPFPADTRHFNTSISCGRSTRCTLRGSRRFFLFSLRLLQPSRRTTPTLAALSGMFFRREAQASSFRLCQPLAGVIAEHRSPSVRTISCEGNKRLIEALPSTLRCDEGYPGDDGHLAFGKSCSDNRVFLDAVTEMRPAGHDDDGIEWYV